MAGERHHTSDIATPAGRPGGLGGLLISRRLTFALARLAIWLAGWFGKPFKIGQTIVAVRHVDVSDVLAQDLEFWIKPINDPPFEVINFRFILGMDRSVELATERAALYAALSRVDMVALRRAALQRAQDLIAAAPREIDVVEGFARPVAAATAQNLFGIRPTDTSRFMDAARAVFYYGFFDAAHDKQVKARAIAAAQAMTQWFDAEIGRRHETGELGSDLMGQLLAQPGVGDDQVRRTLGGMLVGSIDPVAGAVARIISVMMSDAELRASATRDAHDLPKLNTWCFEAMRRWPNGPIVSRSAAGETRLAGVRVKPGAQIIAWTHAAMLDPSAFPDPLAMRPDRPLDAYFHFGGGLHPCAGRSINVWQIPLLVGQLLMQSPSKLGKMRWAGPFPAHLPLHLTGAQT